MISNFWFAAVAIGPVLIGSVIVSAMVRQRRMRSLTRTPSRTTASDRWDEDASQQNR
ncbi:hypothetical protein SAMN05880590_102135 [Rhizobium sp. RU35A]|uniref:hypothetical protein n=1 Tax=Rhizobium sp. RU35A TaxID=1907414 RepID=UPI000955123A|nr:hypothetical protein [Rhizobium sp. RU35A]SIQ12347.1 hypothetical protein SAMN05880590_102135 [Rhizobium sp. RU35A]